MRPTLLTLAAALLAVAACGCRGGGASLPAGGQIVLGADCFVLQGAETAAAAQGPGKVVRFLQEAASARTEVSLPAGRFELTVRGLEAGPAGALRLTVAGIETPLFAKEGGRSQPVVIDLSTSGSLALEVRARGREPAAFEALVLRRLK